MSTYGYDSRRRRRARRDAARQAGARRARLILIVTLVGLAVFAIVYDRRTVRMEFPQQEHTTSVTTTLPPHPATTPRHP